jgi:hypothetical protein
MKTNQDSLDRLFQSAARAPRPALGEMPEFLPTRVLAEWRTPAQEFEFPPVMRMLRIGLGFACVVMVAVTVLHYQQEAQTDLYGLDMLSPAINLTMMQ